MEKNESWIQLLSRDVFKLVFEYCFCKYGDLKVWTLVCKEWRNAAFSFVQQLDKVPIIVTPLFTSFASKVTNLQSLSVVIKAGRVNQLSLLTQILSKSSCLNKFQFIDQSKFVYDWNQHLLPFVTQLQSLSINTWYNDKIKFNFASVLNVKTLLLHSRILVPMNLQLASSLPRLEFLSCYSWIVDPDCSQMLTRLSALEIGNRSGLRSEMTFDFIPFFLPLRYLRLECSNISNISFVSRFSQLNHLCLINVMNWKQTNRVFSCLQSLEILHLQSENSIQFSVLGLSNLTCLKILHGEGPIIFPHDIDQMTPFPLEKLKHFYLGTRLVAAAELSLLVKCTALEYLECALIQDHGYTLDPTMLPSLTSLKRLKFNVPFTVLGPEIELFPDQMLIYYLQHLPKLELLCLNVLSLVEPSSRCTTSQIISQNFAPVLNQNSQLKLIIE